jgi:hypothetical protein
LGGGMARQGDTTGARADDRDSQVIPHGKLRGSSETNDLLTLNRLTVTLIDI